MQFVEPESRIKAFARLGKLLRVHTIQPTRYNEILATAVIKSCGANNWFTPNHVWFALQALGHNLTEENLRRWTSQYLHNEKAYSLQKTAGVIMAGNIPAVGFHDFLCVLMAGYHFWGKLSSNDMFLLPALTEILIDIEPPFAPFIHFSTKDIPQTDVVIATGSANTSRYFNYHYGDKPHIFRKNRNGIAILTGNETETQLKALAQDVFLHFGLGCRNVSKLFLPNGYTFDILLKACKSFDYLRRHKGYRDNLRYYGAIFSINDFSFQANNLIIFHQNADIASPVSVLNYEFYSEMGTLETILSLNADKIQCVVGSQEVPYRTIDVGCTQTPQLADYADGVDTLQFLFEQLS
ncbi:MAG: hypothetical protein U1C46_08855 [Bacteroidales bacterium]|nr:hypothetical protein [Bacteroidales bacterium]